MKIDHLRAAVMNPPTMRGLPAHVFVVHTDDGVVLVDTGFGTADLADTRRLGVARFLLYPERDRNRTLLAQLEARGISASDVAHVVLTHLDLDHAGGVADFPDATVHTTADEHAAFSARSLRDRSRYRPIHLAHGPKLKLYSGPGDRWRDELTGHEVLPGITLVPMPGHTVGHAAVAVQSDEGLVVHAGDAVFDASQVRPEAEGFTPDPLIRVFEQCMAHDHGAVRRNHRALAALAADGVLVVPAHDRRVTAALVDAG